MEKVDISGTCEDVRVEEEEEEEEEEEGGRSELEGPDRSICVSPSDCIAAKKQYLRSRTHSMVNLIHADIMTKYG